MYCDSENSLLCKKCCTFHPSSITPLDGRLVVLYSGCVRIECDRLWIELDRLWIELDRRWIENGSLRLIRPAGVGSPRVRARVRAIARAHELELGLELDL
jgi:hypothetical protein